jgi:predicted MFS family arabinose efflux permease
MKQTGAASTYGLALLFLVSFFNYLDRMVIAVMVEPMKRDLGMSDTQVGLVSGLAFAFLYAVCGLPLARMADRGPRKWLLAFCLAGWSGMTALTGMVRNFGELFVARMAVGVGEAGCIPAAHSMIGDMFSPERRAFAIGVFQAGGLLGLSIGLAVAGFLTESYGWRRTLLWIGLAGLPLAALVAFTTREPPRQSALAAGEPMMEALRALAGRPALAHLIAGLSIGAFATYGMAQWLPAFFIRSHGASLTEVGLYGAIFGGIAGMAGTIAGGTAMVRLHGRDARWELWLPAACYALALPCYAASFALADLRSALGIQFVAVFLAAGGGAVAISAIQSFAEPHRRATAVAVMMFLSSLIGLGAGPAAVGATSDALAVRFGPDSLRFALIISTLFLIWAAGHFLAAARAITISQTQGVSHASA